MTGLAAGLSLLAAALFAVAAVLQHRGTEGIADDAALGAGFVAQLVRRRVWLAGVAADAAGFGAQAGALAVGSLLLVQPLLVTTLLFALPLAAWTRKRRLSAAEWSWAGVLIVALVVFLLLGEPRGGITRPSFTAWIVPLVVLVAVVAVCIGGGARMRRSAARSFVLALGAGVLLGYAAPLTKTAMDAFGRGIVAGLTTWELWAMIVTVALGALWQQSSYQAGSVQTSLPTVTVAEPVVATALGLTLYHERLGGRGGDVAVVVAVAAMVVATIALARRE